MGGSERFQTSKQQANEQVHSAQSNIMSAMTGKFTQAAGVVRIQNNGGQTGVRSQITF